MVEADYFMTTEEVAEFLLIKPKTVANWRALKPPFGPKFRKFGNRPRYLRSDVLAWADAPDHQPVLAKNAATKPSKAPARPTKGPLEPQIPLQHELDAIDRERDDLWRRLAALNAKEEELREAS